MPFPGIRRCRRPALLESGPMTILRAYPRLVALPVLVLLGFLLACSGDDSDAPTAEPRTLPSGLIITELEAGGGASPGPADTVKVHYEGSFPDGEVFDSSVRRRKPATFPLDGVIPCWTEALQLMKVGGKAQLVCPPDIAYGVRGLQSRIPPNSTLHFEVELLEIQ